MRYAQDGAAVFLSRDDAGISPVTQFSYSVERKDESPSTQRSRQETAVQQANLHHHAREHADYFTRHPEQTNRYQRRILQTGIAEVQAHLPQRQGRILDLGCGTGYFTLPFLQRGFEVTSVDLSPEMIGTLKQRIPVELLPLSRRVISNAADFLTGENEPYHAVIISALLHHLYDFETLLKSVAPRVLPGGVVLIFFEPLKARVDSRWRFACHRLLAHLDEWTYRRSLARKNIFPLSDDPMADYQRQFGGIVPEDIIKQMTQCGMKLFKRETYCVRRNAWFAWFANRWLKTHNTFNLLFKKAGEPGNQELLRRLD